MRGLGKISKEKVCKNIPKMYFFEPKSYEKVPKVTKKVQFWTKIDRVFKSSWSFDKLRMVSNVEPFVVHSLPGGSQDSWFRKRQRHRVTEAPQFSRNIGDFWGGLARQNALV